MAALAYYPGGAEEVPVVADTLSGVVTPLATASNGAPVGGGQGVAISANGRRVAFTTMASLIQADADTGYDVYYRDMDSGVLTLVSSGTDVRGAVRPGISGDGNTVAYVFQESNPSRPVMVWKAATNATMRVPGDVGSDFDGALPSLSGDGRLVAFGDTGVTSTLNSSVRLWDTTTGNIETVSLTNSGVPATGLNGQSGISMSADARFVTFSTRSNDLGQSGLFGGQQGLVLRDRLLGTSTLVSRADTGASLNVLGLEGSSRLVTDDGSMVVFLAIASAPVDTLSTAGIVQMYRWGTPAPVDAVSPVVTGEVSPNPVNGWYNTPVTVRWSAVDPDPSSGTPTTPLPTVVDTDRGGQLVTSGLSCDPAGNCATGSVMVSIDLTAPTISGVRTPVANSAGWNNTAVTVSFGCFDGLSGVASCGPVALLSSEDPDQSVVGVASDVAGNSASATVNGINIDLTAPTTGIPVLSLNPKPVTATTGLSVTVADGLSGVAGAEYFVGVDPGPGGGTLMAVAAGTASATIGTALETGVHSIGVRSVDAAGNWSDTSSIFLVVYDATVGYATGGGWIVPGSVTSDAADLLPGLDGASKANFGFVVKYQNGTSTVPGGNLTFHYKVGSFKLKSAGMDWLVVTNSNWARFQGQATIDGVDGLYPFRVDARDGDGNQGDRFIIRIWAPGANPDVDSAIYKASGDVTGQVIIHRT